MLKSAHVPSVPPTGERGRFSFRNLLTCRTYRDHTGCMTTTRNPISSTIIVTIAADPYGLGNAWFYTARDGERESSGALDDDNLDAVLDYLASDEDGEPWITVDRRNAGQDGLIAKVAVDADRIVEFIGQISA